MMIHFAALVTVLSLCPFPCFLFDGGPRHYPSFHITAPVSDLTFGPVPQILNSCQWPAKHPASACACGHLQVSVLSYPPLRETQIDRWSWSSFVPRHPSAKTFHQTESTPLGWRICVEAVEKPVSGIPCSHSSGWYFGSFLVASQHNWETMDDLQCSWKKLVNVVDYPLSQGSQSRSWWAWRRSHPCWAHRGNAGIPWLASSAQEQQPFDVWHRSQNTDGKHTEASTVYVTIICSFNFTNVFEVTTCEKYYSNKSL